jgi:hypothetical protein
MADQTIVDPNGQTKPKHTGLIIGGVIALVILLAGAAFVGGRLLNRHANGSDNGVSISNGPGGQQEVRVITQLEPAKELPATAPDARGLFASRKDNSIFVTLGDHFMTTISADGSVSIQADGNSQQLEIVVTTDTKVYKDVTQPPDVKSVPTDGKVQQQVAPGAIDEISTNSFISAWGDKRGDRLIATVLVYSYH